MTSVGASEGIIHERLFKKGSPDRDLRRVTFNELSNILKFAHDEIWEGGKRDPAVSFDEISKLMFAKIHDERSTPSNSYYEFQVGAGETPAEVAYRIERLYEKAREKEPGVFKSKISLPAEVISRIVRFLQNISLMHTDLDAKGRAFETFLSKLFRGEYGQYFTRREIVEFAVEVVNPDEDDFIIDPACGSGGFLLYSLNTVRRKIKERYHEDQRTMDRIEWDFARKQLFGIEINDRIARVAMMGMFIHDDGHSNIETNDGLSDYQLFDPRKSINRNKFTVVLTNPPFGSLVQDKKKLEQYTLAEDKDRQKTEILFIERCIDLLDRKKGGRLGIVIPDGILTNASTQYVRDFIQKEAIILGCVSLPDCTFVPAGSGVKASLLFLRKKKTDDDEQKNILMALAEHVGYDATGRPDTNDLPDILEKFKEFLATGEFVPSEICFSISPSTLEGRLDPYYYQPKFVEALKDLEKSPFECETLGNIAEKITGGATPTAKSGAYTTAEGEEYTKGGKVKGIPFLRIQNISENEIDLTNIEYITPEIHNTLLRRSQLKPNDILFTITGRIGTAAVVPPNLGQANINQHIVKITLKDESINPYYVATFLNSRLGRIQSLRKVTGTTRIALDYEAIRSIKIPLPPKLIQDEIAKSIQQGKEEAARLRREALLVLARSSSAAEKILMGT